MDGFDGESNTNRSANNFGVATAWLGIMDVE